MAVENIRGAIEAILFANGASVEFSRIAQALEISEKKVKEHISALIDDYEASGRGITIILLDNSCQMVSKKEFAPQIRTVMDLRRNTPLSQAALEVLAVVAYNQPVTKAFVEQVRGVDCSGVIGSLTTKGLVEERADLSYRADRCFTAQPRTFCVALTFQVLTNFLRSPRVMRTRSPKKTVKNRKRLKTAMSRLICLPISLLTGSKI